MTEMSVVDIDCGRHDMNSRTSFIHPGGVPRSPLSPAESMRNVIDI